MLRLIKNISLRLGLTNANELWEFADWVLKVGDGKIGGPNDGKATIDIPEDFLIKEASDPIAAIVDSIYPRTRKGSTGSSYFKKREILAPINEIVDKIN